MQTGLLLKSVITLASARPCDIAIIPQILLMDGGANFLLYILQVFVEDTMPICFDNCHGFFVRIDMLIELVNTTRFDHGILVSLVEEYIGLDAERVFEDMLDQ